MSSEGLPDWERLLAAERRDLYRPAASDTGLRHRLLAVEHRVPLPYPGFWRASRASLGEPVDWTVPLPEDHGIA